MGLGRFPGPWAAGTQRYGLTGAMDNEEKAKTS